MLAKKHIFVWVVRGSLKLIDSCDADKVLIKFYVQKNTCKYTRLGLGMASC